jgi:uncharacterized protein YuzE
MIIEIENLIKALKPIANPNDTLPAEALWIKVASYPKGERSRYEKAVQTVDYRTPDGNTLVNIDLDQQGAILGIEIFLSGASCREGPM